MSMQAVAKAADSPAQSLSPAGFIERFLAFCIDVNLVVYPIAGLALLIGDQKEWVAITFGGLLWLAFFLYPAFSWWRWGQTLGQRLFSLKVMRLEGDELVALGPGRAALRMLLLLLSALPFGLGLLWIKTNDLGRGWHDFGAGTCVVRLKPRSRRFVWITRAIFGLIMVGTFLGIAEKGFEVAMAKERAKVDAARDVLLDLSELEVRFHTKTGRYASTLQELADETGAPVAFTKNARARTEEGSLTFAVSQTKYQISAKAKDARHTQIVLDGPPD